MKMRERQSLFAQLMAEFILWIFEQPGYAVTMGECWRPPEMQEIYLQKGLSKTKNSKHIRRLAVDLNLFIGGTYKTDKESYKPLAEKWESMHPDCRSGYRWGFDANHFELLPSE